MKIIKVFACNRCPFIEFDGQDREYYYCEKTGETLALEGRILVKEAQYNSITQEVTPAVYKWVFVLPDEVTEWDGDKIPDDCPLEDLPD